jgi:hypothetical protein
MAFLLERLSPEKGRQVRGTLQAAWTIRGLG